MVRREERHSRLNAAHDHAAHDGRAARALRSDRLEIWAARFHKRMHTWRVPTAPAATVSGLGSSSIRHQPTPACPIPANPLGCQRGFEPQAILGLLRRAHAEVGMSLTDAQRRLLEASKQAARELGDRGRGLTSLVGVIGELSACEEADLVWKPSDGYDASSGRRKFQIKARKSWTTPGVNPSGRLGRYGTKRGYPFDVAMYVELDSDFNTVGIWEMSAGEIRALEERTGAGRGLHIHTFKSGAAQLP